MNLIELSPAGIINKFNELVNKDERFYSYEYQRDYL